MLALGVLKGLTSSDIQRFYLKLKDECFQGKRPYSEIPLESNLRELFGESKLQDFSHPRVIVTSVMADRKDFFTAKQVLTFLMCEFILSFENLK